MSTVQQYETAAPRLRIIRATDAITVKHPIFLLFGEPGIGKSSLGYSARRPLTLDFDDGAHRAANRGDTLQISSWDEVIALSRDPETLANYDTIVPDTVGRCLDLLTADIAMTDPKKAPGGNLSQQGWGVLKNRFRQWVAQLRALDKDMLLIAHHKEEKDGDLRIMRPDIPGGSYGEVMKIADFVGYVYMSGKDRVLDFNPTDRWSGKNPGNWAPFKIPPAAKATTFMAELMDRGREALGKISEASADAARQVQDWRSNIETFKLAEEFNRAIPEIKKTGPVIQPQIVKLLMERAEALSIPFDRAAKLFLPAPPPPSQAPLGGLL